MSSSAFMRATILVFAYFICAKEALDRTFHKIEWIIYYGYAKNKITPYAENRPWNLCKNLI